jgi:transposase
MWSVVNVPSVEAEDGRHLHRELDVLNKERKMHRSRIKSLLFQHAIAVKNPSSRRFLIELETFRSWQGKQLPSDLKARIIREHARLRMVEEQGQTVAFGSQSTDYSRACSLTDGRRADLWVEKRARAAP